MVLLRTIMIVLNLDTALAHSLPALPEATVLHMSSLSKLQASFLFYLTAVTLLLLGNLLHISPNAGP